MNLSKLKRRPQRSVSDKAPEPWLLRVAKVAAIPPRVPDVSGMGTWRKGPNTTTYHTGLMMQQKGKGQHAAWPAYNRHTEWWHNLD